MSKKERIKNPYLFKIEFKEITSIKDYIEDLLDSKEDIKILPEKGENMPLSSNKILNTDNYSKEELIKKLNEEKNKNNQLLKELDNEKKRI